MNCVGCGRNLVDRNVYVPREGGGPICTRCLTEYTDAWDNKRVCDSCDQKQVRIEEKNRRIETQRQELLDEKDKVFHLNQRVIRAEVLADGLLDKLVLLSNRLKEKS